MTRRVDPFYAIQESPVPIIGCVRGAAMTGGFEIALSCDIVIASQDALFRDNHAMCRYPNVVSSSEIALPFC